MHKILLNPKCLILFLIISWGMSLPQAAKAQVIDSMYYGWIVYEYQKNPQDDSNKKCYIVATPHKTNSSYTADRNPYFSITRYAQDRTEEVSAYSGYEYKISSDVYLLVGGRKKQLFTKDDTAWAKSDYDDKEIINLMLNNQDLKVRSDSSTGNYAIDEYEMKGLTRAYARMKELCR
jgi:hypothetical protein